MTQKKKITSIFAITLILIFFIGVMPCDPVDAATPGASKITSVKRTTPISTSVKVSWKKVSGAYGYSLYHATSENGKYLRIRSTVKTTWTDTKLKTGKTYYYKVRTYKYINGKRVYGLYSKVNSIKMTYINPGLILDIDKGLPDYPTENSNPYSIGLLLKASKYSLPVTVLTEVKRPEYEKKIFACVYKNAVNGKTTKKVYYQYNPERDVNYFSGGYPNIKSTGNSQSDYKYFIIDGSKNYGISKDYLNWVYLGMDPLNYKTSAGRYNPKEDILEFFVLYRDQMYSIKYDAVNGVKTKKI